MLEYRLLGPVQVYDDGRLIEARPPRQRLVLAALLVDAGEVVGWDTLVDWVPAGRAAVAAARQGDLPAQGLALRKLAQV